MGKGVRPPQSPRGQTPFPTGSETELAAVYPMHVVCAWIGNTERIAAKHYLQVTEAYFAEAAGKSGAPAAQNQAQQAAACSRREPQQTQKPRENPGVLQECAAPCETVRTPVYPQGDSNPCLSRERAMS